MGDGRGLFMARECISPNCRAIPMRGDDFCYWHSPNISEEEKQRSRALGGRSSKKVEVWAIPDDLGEIETLLDVKRVYKSLIHWVLMGHISPAQALAVKALLSGYTEAIEAEYIEQMLDYRRRLELQLQELGEAGLTLHWRPNYEVRSQIEDTLADFEEVLGNE